MKKDWLDSIRERMDGYESSVPDGLWDEIEASVFSESKKSRRVILPWVWGLAAVIAGATKQSNSLACERQNATVLKQHNTICTNLTNHLGMSLKIRFVAVFISFKVVSLYHIF